MRVVAGQFRGRQIETPVGLDTRPTTDRIREAIMSSVFSMIGGYDGKVVLDAFAGSGAFGIEAISRGASKAVFNDFSVKSRQTIERNLHSLNIEQQSIVLSTNIFTTGIPIINESYDIMFLDPPYKNTDADVVSVLLDAQNKGAFSNKCVVVYEHANAASDLFSESGIELVKEKQYGKTYASYFIC